jgi:hypothetical protein
LRLQARAYMLAHGANPDAMGEDDFELVMVALNDGLFGNKALINVNGALTTGVFNYIRSQNAQAYKLQDVLGIMHDYIYRPLTDEEKQNLVNEQLLTFMTMKPDVPDLLKPKI